MKKSSKYSNTYILSLVLFAIATHITWFDPFSIMNASDWGYWPDEPVRQLWYSYGTWVNFFNLGAVNIQIPFNLFTLAWSLLANVGLSYDVATKITFLMPIAVLGFVAPYILFEKMTGDRLIAFISALFYGTTTHFLVRQTAHLPIAFVYALTPLIIYLFMKALEKNKLSHWISFTLIYWVSICYETRITYIVTFILFFYFLMFHTSDIRRYSKNIAVSIASLISLNVFWLLPMLLTGSSESISAVANRGLFGNALFDLRNAFVLSESAWTGGLLDNQFIKQPIIAYFWSIPLIAFSVFLLKKKRFEYRREIVFFGAIALLGVFLTKQSDAPLPDAYLWLYKNFPGFNLFREASKFYLLTAIGYAGLISYSLMALRENKIGSLNRRLFSIFSVIIIAVSLWNVKPLITGDIKTMFVSRHVPMDYIVLNDFILKQSEYFRTLWLPTASRWSMYTNEKPKISGVAVVGGEWKDFIDTKKHPAGWPAQEQIMDIAEKDFSNQLFDVSSVKYVIVPIRDIENEDDFFVYYGGLNDPNIRDWYVSELDKVDWLKRIDIETQDLVVYENEAFKPHIYSTKEKENIYDDVSFDNVDWEFVNPTEYRISLKNISRSSYLNFSESFHRNWKLRAGEFGRFDVLTEDEYFLSDEFHYKNNAGLNTFKIDPAYIREKYPDSYKENPDGSIDVELTLYFKPQSWFYLGLIVSGTTLAGCLGYLGYAFMRRKREEV